MRVDPAEFIDEVQARYISNPTRVSSIAFWKLEGFLRRGDTYRVIHEGQVHLYALRENRLSFYWSARADRFVITPSRLRKLDFLVIHEDYYPWVERRLDGLEEDFEISEIHPLLYDFSQLRDAVRNGAYQLDDFDFSSDEEYDAAARLIRATSGAYSVTTKSVRQWTEGPMFDASLWVWARERETGERVGIGVSTYDRRIREADLDWFFVLPGHQGRGVGRMLVDETVRRVRDRSSIIRVSGAADDFYIKCGFRTRDRWFLIQKR